MISIVLLFVLLKRLIHYPQLVGDAWDEETRFRMEVHAKQLEWERIRLEQEVERLTLKQLQLMELLQLLAVAVLGFLVLVLWLMGEAANAENNDRVPPVYQGDNDLDDNIGRILMERIQRPVQDLQAGCEWTRNLMDNFALYFGHVLSNTFYPGLQGAIGVGSAFEGWSPREHDVVYQVLIPMTPPRGHSFHLELDSAGQRHKRNFRIRVQLECTCTKEKQAENMLCFLHHSREELRRNQDPSLLDTLCTNSYLDVKKTARWFYQLVRVIWPALPQSHNWHLKLLPSRRSCQFQVTNGREIFTIEMFFGVRRGDSDIFVSSQTREAHTKSTTWPETYAVAEMKFFKHIAKQAPPDSVHFKCLEFFTHLLLAFNFPTCTTKTIVMHLLDEVPMSRWRRRHLLNRLLDISQNLRLCVLVKRLNHFILGNQRLPQDIHLPPDVQAAQPYNLFYHLAEEPDVHNRAMNDYRDAFKGTDKGPTAPVATSEG
uniref:Mab-21-like HhH/H2TH-like domain-containing protein n=1 Tax=Catharus ustulatus TaxID=91951 RepID=A0A8C3U764_CATUS